MQIVQWKPKQVSFLWVIALIGTTAIVHAALLLGTRYLLDYWIGDANLK